MLIIINFSTTGCCKKSKSEESHHPTFSLSTMPDVNDRDKISNHKCSIRISQQPNHSTTKTTNNRCQPTPLANNAQNSTIFIAYKPVPTFSSLLDEYQVDYLHQMTMVFLFFVHLDLLCLLSHLHSLLLHPLLFLHKQIVENQFYYLFLSCENFQFENHVSKQ